MSEGRRKIPGSEAVERYVWGLLSPEQARLARLAAWDLYFGPSVEDDDGEPWPGFETAVDTLREALADLGELWVDVDCNYVLDVEPEPYEDPETGEEIEPYWASIYYYDRQEALQVAFGALASYL